MPGRNVSSIVNSPAHVYALKTVTLLGVAVLSACAAQKPPIVDEGSLSLQQESIAPRSRLINEGGVVFAVPGEVRFPNYFKGAPQDLVVRGERLDGGRLAQFPVSSLDSDGRFSFKSRLDGQIFVVAVEFNQDQHRYALKSVVKGDANDPVVLDVVSSMLAARVQLAAREGSTVQVDYREVRSLADAGRLLFGADLADFNLERSPENLAYQFEAFSQPYGVLLANWKDFDVKLLRAKPELPVMGENERVQPVPQDSLAK